VTRLAFSAVLLASAWVFVIPRDVLEKVYAKNAERVIPESAGAGDRR